MTTPDTSTNPVRRRGRKWARFLRAALAAFAILVLVATVSFWVATRSWFIIWQVTPVLEDRLGGQVQIDRAIYDGDGRITFRDVKLRARNLPGPAGEIASINRAVVVVSLKRLIPFQLGISDIEVDQSRLRISEQEHEGWLNLMALRPKPRRADKEKVPPPRILLRHAAIEFGRHTESEYRVVETRLFSGEMQPARDLPHMYNFKLTEVDDYGVDRRDGLRLTGNLNAQSNRWQTQVDEVELNERIYRICPAVVQNLWANMDLQGKVKRVEASWSPEQSFAFKLDVENVNLTLPVESTIQWARFRGGRIESTSARPRLQFAQGTIRITAESFELEKLVGEMGGDAGADETGPVISVPYELSLTMKPLPPLDWKNPEGWMKQILKETPFALDFRVAELNLGAVDGGEVPAIDLPLVLARVLEKFGVTQCVLSTNVQVSRQAVAEGGESADTGAAIAPPKTIATGQAYLRNASGRYRKFAYPLENVDAYLQFDNDKVTVHYLNATGSGKSKFRITGEIAPPDNDASVSLHLVATDVPVDDRLRSALQGGELEAYDMFFNRDTYEAMKNDGLIPDESAMAEAEATRVELLQQLEQLKQESAAADPQIAEKPQRELQEKLNRLQNSIQAGAFQSGGLINVDLKIERALGDRQPTITTGIIDIQSVGFIYERFPYPLRFTSGRLDWQKERVLAMPAPGTTAEGLTFVTPAGGRGVVTGELAIQKGRIDPSAAPASTGGFRGSIRPALNIKAIDDEFNEGLHAAIDRGARREPKGEAIQKDAAPENSVGKLTPGEFVRRLGLNGAFDWDGDITTNAQGRIDYEFAIAMKRDRAELQPQLAQVIGASGESWPKKLVMEDISGNLRVRRDRVDIEQISAAVPGLGSEGALSFNGVYTWGGRSPNDEETAAAAGEPAKPSFMLQGSLGQTLLESPLVLELLGLFADQRVIKTYEECRPVGLFDAEFFVESPGKNSSQLLEGGPEWWFTFKPRTVGLTWRDRPVAASFQDWERGGIKFSPDGISIREVHGQHDRGDFLVDGTIVSRAPMDVQLQITHVGQVRSDFMEAFLPNAVRKVLDAIEFNDAGATVLDDCRLHMTQIPSSADGAAMAWRTEFNGPVRLSAASVDAGVKFTEVNAAIDLNVLHEPGNPLQLNMQIQSDLARAMGQHLKGTRAALNLTEDGQRLQLNEFRADAEAGVIAATAWTGVGEQKEYEVAIDMAGVPLQHFSIAGTEPAPVATGTAKSSAPPAVNGELHASISISGRRGEAESRRGRAVMRILNGRLAGVPLAMQLLQFTAGTGDLDSADANMYLFGDRLFFSPIHFEATSASGNTALLRLSGEGEMNVETLELKNARFRSRGSVPLVRDIVGGVSDALYTIEVTGPLNNPKARVVPLPAPN